MARQILIQNSFSSGELSERMAARTDLEPYKSGVSELINFELEAEGGATKRKGIKSIEVTAGLQYISGRAKAINYKTINGSTFVLVFDSYGAWPIKAYQFNSDTLTANSSIKVQDTYGLLTSNCFPTDYIQIGDLLICAYSDGFPFVVYYKEGTIYVENYVYFLNKEVGYHGIPLDPTRVDRSVTIACSSTTLGTNTLTATKDSFSFPFFEKLENKWSYAYRNFLALHHVNATANHVFTTSFHRLFDATFGSTFGQCINNTTNITVSDISVTPNGTKVKYTQLGVTNVGYCRQSGGFLNIYHTWLDAKNSTNIVSFTADTSISLTVVGAVSVTCYTEVAALDTIGTTVFYESCWNSNKGYPTCVSIVSGRLVFSGVEGYTGYGFLSDYSNLFRINPVKLRQDDQTYYKVNTVATDVSKLGYFGERLGTDPDARFLCGDSVAKILWIKSTGTATIIGTDRNEVAISIQTGETYTTVNTAVVSTYGSTKNLALSLTNQIFFIDAYNNLIQVVASGDQEAIGSVKVGNISALNSTILDSAVANLAFDRKRQVLFISLESTDDTKPVKIIGYTTSRLTGVAGFFKFNYDFYQFEQIAPNEEKPYLNDICVVDDRLMLISYTGFKVGAGTRFCIEDPTTLLDFGTQAVTSRLKTMPLDFGNPYGTSQSIMRRIHEVSFKLYKSKYIKFGSNVGDIEEGGLDVSTEFTGEKTLNFPASPERTACVIIENDTNYPLTVLGLVYKGEGYE